MPLSPELKVMPQVSAKFFQSGVATELIASLIAGDKKRSLVEDARRVANEFERSKKVEITGLENIDSGAVLTFNHPNSDVILPGFLRLIIDIHDKLGRDVNLVMATEIPMSGHLNDKKEVPGSISFLERFHKLYGGAIISTPTIEKRSDYLNGRAVALRKIFRSLNAGNIIAISPEGHTEENGIISPVDTFHSGSGSIAMLAAKRDIPTIPVGIWESKKLKTIYVKIGAGFYPTGNSGTEAVESVMRHVAALVPPNLRGPFDETGKSD